MQRVLSVMVGLVVLAAAVPARSGGYDTPMLYSARHMGMGGTAAAYVNDPSSLFHNPAGLGQIKKLSLLGDFSLLLGGIQASPDAASINADSELVMAPFFLVGGGVRVLDFLTLGLAVYPVASASAAFKYDNAAGNPVENSTKLVFIETSLGAAVNFDRIGLRIGGGYRVTAVTLARNQTVNDVDSLAFDMSGWNFLGFRVGVQWTPPWSAIRDHLSLGVSYRHKTVTEVTQDEVTIPALLGGTATDGSAEFTLPGRMIFGVRGDYANFGAAVDLEYAFNSQNKATVIAGTLPSGSTIELANVFEWDNAVTLRLGGEYRIGLGAEKLRWIIPRLGFVFDGRTANKQYPTAFGTPPSPTYVITGGAGFEQGPYRINLAYAYRFGSTTITPEDLAGASQNCTFCSVEGDYSIHLNGIFLDFSYDFQ